MGHMGRCLPEAYPNGNRVPGMLLAHKGAESTERGDRPVDRWHASRARRHLAGPFWSDPASFFACGPARTRESTNGIAEHAFTMGRPEFPPCGRAAECQGRLRCWRPPPAKGPSTNYRIGNCRILDGASPLFLAGRQLAISVDARKKGLVGDFSNGGR